MALYSETVMDHFRHPRNVGVIENADGVGEVGNAKCGDIMKIYLKIENDTISDVKFETFGCASAIASSSMATELIKGKPVSEAMTLTNQAVAEALEGLPAHKLHCSVLAEEAIQKALEDYAQTLGFEHEEDHDLFLAVMQLERKYRIVVVLYYYEGYSTSEIASMLGVPVNTVSTRLARARAKLRTLITEVE